MDVQAHVAAVAVMRARPDRRGDGRQHRVSRNCRRVSGLGDTYDPCAIDARIVVSAACASALVAKPAFERNRVALPLWGSSSRYRYSPPAPRRRTEPLMPHRASARRCPGWRTAGSPDAHGSCEASGGSRDAVRRCLPCGVPQGAGVYAGVSGCGPVPARSPADLRRRRGGGRSWDQVGGQNARPRPDPTPSS